MFDAAIPGSWHRPDITAWSRDGALLYVRSMQFRGMELSEREYIYSGRIRGACVQLADMVPMVEVPPDELDQVICRTCKHAHRLSGTTVATEAACADGWKVVNLDTYREYWTCDGCLACEQDEEWAEGWGSDA